MWVEGLAYGHESKERRNLIGNSWINLLRGAVAIGRFRAWDGSGPDWPISLDFYCCSNGYSNLGLGKISAGKNGLRLRAQTDGRAPKRNGHVAHRYPTRGRFREPKSKPLCIRKRARCRANRPFERITSHRRSRGRVTLRYVRNSGAPRAPKNRRRQIRAGQCREQNRHGGLRTSENESETAGGRN